MSVRATYRLQFHAAFTFAQATALVPYLASLGISHVYASPVTTARRGSMHGYDVVDPTRIDPELGGEEGFRALVAALRDEGMGMIIDIVPNHLGVASVENRWWQDVLENGPASKFARFFDIDWSDKLLLPFLAVPLRESLANGALALRYDANDERLFVVANGTDLFPVRREDYARVIPSITSYDPATKDGRERLFALFGRQHYRLAWWRVANDELNWRRFFTITELAGVRVEDPVVFEATHGLYFRLYAEGLIDGVRVDHVDGLADPRAWCRSFRERLSSLEASRPASAPRGPAWIVVEKILGPGESLATDWGVDGTTGYDFMAEVTALLHAPAGCEPLTRFWVETSARSAEFSTEELAARGELLGLDFAGQLRACVQAFKALAETATRTEELSAGMLRRALVGLLKAFPVYRCYGTGSEAPLGDASVRALAGEKARQLAAPGEQFVVDCILAWLAGGGPGDAGLAADAVRQFQQLSAPVAAKAVEDTAFYRYGRLLSRNDVGFDPARFSMNAAEFHDSMSARWRTFPHSMLATATHDHKRGEDLRARLAVLSEVPEEWIAAVERWFGLHRQLMTGLAPDDVYQLYQVLFGGWPEGLSARDSEGLAAFGRRIAGWQQKALREARLRSSWADPDCAYEARARRFLDAILDHSSGAFLNDLVGFARRLRPAGEANSLVQAFLRNTVPGVPDLYQGAEYEDLSLVDPDNRRSVDFAARQRSLDDADSGSFDGRKQVLIAHLLRLRRDNPALFRDGSYEPVPVEGRRAAHVLAFTRRHGDATLLAAAALYCAPGIIASGGPVPRAEWWGDTRLVLPASKLVARPYREVPGTRRDIGDSATAASLFTHAPVYLALYA